MISTFSLVGMHLVKETPDARDFYFHIKRLHTVRCELVVTLKQRGPAKECVASFSSAMHTPEPPVVNARSSAFRGSPYYWVSAN